MCFLVLLLYKSFNIFLMGVFYVIISHELNWIFYGLLVSACHNYRAKVRCLEFTQPKHIIATSYKIFICNELMTIYTFFRKKCRLIICYIKFFMSPFVSNKLKEKTWKIIRKLSLIWSSFQESFINIYSYYLDTTCYCNIFEIFCYENQRE